VGSVAYVLGNGPSRDRKRKEYDGVTYGCNSIYKEMDVDVLVVMDAWYQFEVISSGYPAEHDCLFGEWNPMPIGVPPESVSPPSFDQYEYNPEDRKRATDWCYYATSAADYKRSVDEKYGMSYWKPDCGYVCWVGENYRIKETNYGVIPIGDLRPPSGACALQEALKSCHDRVEVHGFDSIAGVFSTSASNDRPEFEVPSHVTKGRMDDWRSLYKTIVEHYNEIEIIWKGI
jgi:hypothetical protein